MTLRLPRLSDEERRRASEVEALGRSGDVDALVDRLTDRSWMVRRAVVSTLARLGDAAIGPLCAILADHRDDEARIAAAVDALVASSGAADDAVLAMARSPNTAVVCDAAQILGRRKCGRAMATLAALAKSADDNIALAAIEAVGAIGGETAIAPLAEAVQGGNFFRAFPAIDVLGRTGDPRAVAPLCALLAQPHYAVEAARALGHTAQPPAVPALAALLVRPNDAVVRTAAAALVEIHDRHAERYGPSRVVPDGIRGIDGNAATRRLTQAFTGADGRERVALGRLLGWLGGENAVHALVELLDADPATASAAANAITSLDKEAEPLLLAALHESEGERRLLLVPILARRASSAGDIVACLADAHPGVRAVVCDALGKLGDRGSIPALFDLLGDQDGRVSQAAVGAIQSMGGSESERLALRAAHSSDVRVRRSALRIMSYFGWPSALDAFLEALGDADERLRDVAAAGLMAIDDDRAVDAVLAATTHASPRTRLAAVRALGRGTSSPAVRDRLRAALSDPDAWVRYYACQSLSRLHDDSAVDAVRTLLDDRAGHVRVAAIEALGRLRGAQALEALHAAAASPDGDVQRAALLAIASVRNASSLPLLCRAVSADDAATRLVALSALAEFAEESALACMRTGLRDADDAVRNAAVTLIAGRSGVEATHALIEELGNPVLRDRVRSALAIPAEGRVEGLVSALRHAPDDVVPHLVSALARMRRADASAALEDVFASDNQHTRRVVAQALAALDTDSGRRLLERAAASDPDLEVRQVCEVLTRR